MAAPKILVVDDEPAVLSVLMRFANYAGYEAIGACSAEQTWDQLREHGDTGFAAFVLDGLEGKGTSLATEIRARGFTGPIVCMTTNAEIRTAMMQPGLCTHEGTKPIGIDAFVALLHEAIPLSTAEEPVLDLQSEE